VGDDLRLPLVLLGVEDVVGTFFRFSILLIVSETSTLVVPTRTGRFSERIFSISSITALYFPAWSCR